MTRLTFIFYSFLPASLLLSAYYRSTLNAETAGAVALFYMGMFIYIRGTIRHRKSLSALCHVLNLAASGELHHRATHTKGYGVAAEMAWSVNELLDFVETYFKEVKLCFQRVNQQDFTREAKATGLPGDFSESLKSINRAIIAIKDNLNYTSQNKLTGQIHDLNLESLREDLHKSAADVQSIRSAIDQVGLIATENSEVSENSSRSVHLMSDSLHRSTCQLQELQQQADELNEASRAVSSALNLITDIADQTSLLALNASVEAARAGEAGRGFAVVADEVKKLSARTKDTATEVYQVLGRLNDQVAAIRQVTDTSSTLSAEITGQLDDFIHLFNALEQSSRQTSEKVSEVANHAESAVQRIAQVIYKQNLYALLEEKIVGRTPDPETLKVLGEKARSNGPACQALFELFADYIYQEDLGSSDLIQQIRAIESQVRRC